MSMYKKNDFSKEATRAAEITQCGDNGEYGLTVWFGTKSKSAAKVKAHRVMVALDQYKDRGAPEFKSFPRIDTKTKGGK